VTNTQDNKLIKRKGLLWLTASESSVHGPFDLGPVAKQYIIEGTHDRKLLPSWWQGSKEGEEEGLRS
jgi:hypothetical protein